jgi:uncharacterized protein (TIGR00297 family)
LTLFSKIPKIIKAKTSFIFELGMPNVGFPSLSDWYVLSGFTALIAMLLFGTEKWFHLHRIRADNSRKVVHFCTGLLMLASPFLFESSLPLLLILFLFIIANILAMQFGSFPSILSTTRRSWGTVFYPLAFFLLIALFWQRDLLALMVGMSLLAIADVCAAFVGERASRPRKLPLPGDSKSLQGSLAMFGSSFILIAGGMLLFGPAQDFDPAWLLLLSMAAALALLATTGEALSWRGSDNLSVPILGATATHFFVQASPGATQQFLWGEVFALLVAVLSYRLHFLDLGGALSAFLLGTLIFGLGGWPFSLPILSFFILSSLLSRVGTKEKKEASGQFQKGHRRDFGQVLANGAIPAGIVLLWHYAPQASWHFLYLGAVAAVTADTWATEIGLLSRRQPRSITSGQVVAPGTSGAISGTGMLGALSGALCIAIIGWAVQPDRLPYAFGWRGVLILVLGGVAASLLDSLLGATIQAQRACTICHTISEKKGHCCGVERQYHSGWRWVDNDVVNGLCGLSGVLLVFGGAKVLP